MSGTGTVVSSTLSRRVALPILNATTSATLAGGVVTGTLTTPSLILASGDIRLGTASNAVCAVTGSATALSLRNDAGLCVGALNITGVTELITASNKRSEERRVGKECRLR